MSYSNISAIFNIDNIGKIKTGQKAILRFDAFPYKEFGIVESKVGHISKVPGVDNSGQTVYEVQIPLEDHIVTDFSHTIKYKPNMTAQVLIITQNKTLLKRIFNQF